MKNVFKSLLKIMSVLLIISLLAGCGKASFTITGNSSKSTIKVTAEDGKTCEANAMSLSKNKIVKIESELNSGALQIDLMETVNTAAADEPDEYVALDLIQSVTVKPGDSFELSLDYVGEFMPVLTAIGQTEGTVTISVVKP